MATLPLIDLQSGYVLRSLDKMPSQGVQSPWRLHQNYPRDLRMMRRGALADGVLQLSRPPRRGDR
jgi:monooxygenase